MNKKMNTIANLLKTSFKTSLVTLVLVMSFTPVSSNIYASEATFPLDSAPYRLNDMGSLQNGAKLFVNYCLNCHGAVSMRFNRLRDIGLTDQQIKENLLFAGDKVGDLMKVSMLDKESKEWFGKAPPDLSVETRARGSDWVYTYLRTFYRDETRPTGWNNMVYPNVSMPHILWELQGDRFPKFEEVKSSHGAGVDQKFVGFEQLSPGKFTSQEYDNQMADLTAFLTWMSEPDQLQRKRIGVIVLLFLAVFTLFAWRLNKSYWKTIH